MEDIDTARVERGADRHILQTLHLFGFVWDTDVLYQSTRTPVYEAEFQKLRDSGHVYPCGCTRREVGAERYPGTCREGLPEDRDPRAWRVRVRPELIEFQDSVQGPQRENVEERCGDFVVLRADGRFAYQLAVVVDDRDQGVTDVVRGADLLDSTARQIHLQRLLGAPTPRYMHMPVAVDASGQKLSKQTLAPAIDAADAVPLLTEALAFLGQDAPSSTRKLGDLWNCAIANWRPGAVPRVAHRLQRSIVC